MEEPKTMALSVLGWVIMDAITQDQQIQKYHTQIILSDLDSQN